MSECGVGWLIVGGGGVICMFVVIVGPVTL